jgi:DNA-binding NtrC family response regulator
MYKILIDKAAKFNYEVYVVDKELLNSEDAIKYEIEKFNHIDFNIFNEDDDDDIIETSKKILSYYLEKLSNKIFKEFDITFLNKIRSDENCYDLIYLDKVIRQSLKESDSDLITEDDFSKIQTVNDGNKEKNLDDNGSFNLLYKLELREAREHFDKIYLQYHLKNKISMKDLSILTGLERTHLYRKLKQLGLKIS